MGCDCQKCEFPQKLNDRPENCTPEQIRECHGESKEQETESKNQDS